MNSQKTVEVKHTSHRCSRVDNALSDPGSGSMLGVMLVSCIAVAATLLALVGNALICEAQARSAADMAALAAATALRDGDVGPCAVAVESAMLVEALVVACQIDGEDVMVTAAKPTMFAFLPHMEQRSRAGPQACDGQ
jgi:secretion/DNA translocation related TadE-like protein